MKQPINEGKIGKESEAQWVEMANSNYELADNTLKSIPAREIISQEIASDQKNNIQLTINGTQNSRSYYGKK